MNKIIILLVLTFISSKSLYSQYYDTSVMNTIHLNKTGGEGDLYLDTINNVYRIGLTNGKLGYVSKTNPIDSINPFKDTAIVFYYNNGLTDTVSLISISEQSWDINGNNNINHSINFIGTTNSRDLAFRTNNTEKMRVFSLANPSLGIGLTTTAGINGGGSSYSGPTIFLGSAANLSSPTGYDFVIDHDNNSTTSKFRLRANGDGASGTIDLLILEEDGDLFLNGYPNTRADDTTAHLNSLYTDATGNVQSARREIIPPTAFLNTSTVSPGNIFNYYTYYAVQLATIGLKPIPIGSLDFYVFSFDPAVFNNVSISPTGVLTYDIIAISSVKSHIDVRFYTK